MRRAVWLVPALALAQNPPRFEKDVLPIFTENCFTCHGKTAPRLGLDLRTATSALRGSHNGPVIVPGSLDKSLLWEKVSNKKMPPEAYNQKLTAPQIATIKAWIEAGAPSDAMSAAAEHPSLARFRDEVQPLLAKRCAGCHGASKPMAGLDLTALPALLKGGASGPVVVEGASDKSVLIRRVAARTMPPKGAGAPLDDAEIALIRRWVDAGGFVDPVGKHADPADRPFTAAEAPPVTGEHRQFWAFRKPVRAAVPKTKSLKLVRNPIDAFLLSKLEAKGLSFSPEAPRLELVRRVTFDLTGLPPTPEEADAFLADTKPGSYERLVDRLLESKHYGERWGRHWLDAAGFSDTAMRDYDVRTIYYYPGMWRYRDYVIKAHNEDKPWDRFLTEQIAGDELVDWRNAATYTGETRELMVATGYMRNILDRTDEDITNFPAERYEAIFHLIEKMSSGIMGVTVGCARCHSHKFDPIPQRDYYRFLSLLATSYNPADWIQARKRYLYHVAKPEQKEIEKHNAALDERLKPLKAKLDELRKPYETALRMEKLKAVPEAVRDETKLARETPAGKRDEVQKFLIRKFGKLLDLPAAEIDKALTAADRETNDRLRSEIAAIEKERRPLDELNILWDVGKEPQIRLLQRGSVETPGPRVTPGFLAVLSDPGKTDFERPADARGDTSGRRLALARWLTGRDHPLTARVIVNRMWQQHFGAGIVATADNFGKTGALPTHPELLDWLAVDFMENGWKAKRLHRTMVLSSAYRQSSKRAGAGEQADPENKLLWRMNLRRLEAEALRDSILAVSGKLDRAMGGPALMLEMQNDGLHKIADKDKPGENRRSVYLLARRNYPFEFLRVFDFPVIDAACTRRMNSATPLQALTMLNSAFVWDQAEALRERVWSGADRVEALYRLAFQRKPTDAERKICESHLARQGALYERSGDGEGEKRAFASLAQAVISSNEFLYVD